MANIYKNAFFNPADTANTVIYATDTLTRAIIQNIQITNTGGSKNVTARVTDSSATTSYIVAYAAVTGPTICNITKGPIILEESDSISLETSTTSAITASLALLEISRDDQNG